MIDVAAPIKRKRARSKGCPLSLHQTGQWYKKIYGRFHYFGNDKEKALKAYYEQMTALHAGLGATASVETGYLTLRTLSNLYLDHQASRIRSHEISPHYVAHLRYDLRDFAKFIGPTRRVADIVTMEIQNYRANLIDAGRKPTTITGKLGIVKALFRWAEDNQLIEKAPKLRGVKNVHLTKRQQRDDRRIESRRKQTFRPDEIRLLLKHADVQMRAMIWLGINCAFGCTDVAELRWDDLDLEKGAVDLPRGKTGVGRHVALWPETVQALREVPRRGSLVFYTKKGRPWVRDNEETHCHTDEVSRIFCKLLKHVGIETQERTGFYTLRRTAATIAAESGDVFAVQGLLGHTNTQMASVYVQTVKEQTDRAVKSVHSWMTKAPENPK